MNTNIIKITNTFAFMNILRYFSYPMAEYVSGLEVNTILYIVIKCVRVCSQQEFLPENQIFENT